VRASRISLVFSAAGLAVVGMWREPAGLVLGTGIFAVGSSLAFPALMLLALRGTSPAERGSVLGTFTAFVDLAFGLGPATLGFVADVTSYGGTFLTAAGIAVLGFAVVLVGYRRRAAAA
jgi:predicted MFS family arabinose efflux permease